MRYHLDDETDDEEADEDDFDEDPDDDEDSDEDGEQDDVETWQVRRAFVSSAKGQSLLDFPFRPARLAPISQLCWDASAGGASRQRDPFSWSPVTG